MRRALGRAQPRYRPGRLARPQRRIAALPDAGRAPGRSTPERLPPSWTRRPRRPRSTRRGPTRASRYEDAVGAFVAAVWPTRDSSPTWRRSWPSTGSSARGRINSLAQTTLLLTCPGVPDLYQGSELWDLSLVDPDNRRPGGLRRRAAACLTASRVPSRSGALAAARTARSSKLLAHPRLLRPGARHPGVYGPASGYEPLGGRAEADHVVAFARGGGLVVVVPAPARSASASGWDGHHRAAPRRAWARRADRRGRGRRRRRRWTTCSAPFPSRSWPGRPMMHEFRVWAPQPRRVELVLVGERRMPMTASGGRLVDVLASTGRAGHATTASASTAARPGPTPGRPSQPAGRPRPVRGGRPHRLRLERQRWRGVPLPGAVLYELPRRHLHGRRHLRRGDRAPATTWPTSASTPSS